MLPEASLQSFKRVAHRRFVLLRQLEVRFELLILPPALSLHGEPHVRPASCAAVNGARTGGVLCVSGRGGPESGPVGAKQLAASSN